MFGDLKTRKIKEALKPDIKNVQKENKDDIIRIDLGNGQIGNFKSKNISTEK